MTTLTTLTPIVVVIVLSFFFKNTRWISIVAIAVTSYFYPKSFLLSGSLTGLGYGIYRYLRR